MMVDLNINLPEGFLEPETRCGYEVSAKRKSVWAVELDLLTEFDRVCQKNGLTYWVLGGTLLGAIRHNGFIPWDDDIDVFMLRESYEKLCAISFEFEEPYFLQTAYTDKGCFRGHAQLRNSLTTAVTEWEAKHPQPFNQGIFIDIFPFDAAPDSQKELMRQARSVNRRKKACLAMYMHSFNYVRGAHKLHGRIAHPFILALSKCKDYMEVYREMEGICAKYNDTLTNDVSQLCMPTDEIWRRVHRSCLKDTQYCQFEFLTVPIPGGYHEMLRRAYGDYMRPVQAPTSHGKTYFDATIPYWKWLQQNASAV